nr:HPP family protein [Bowmanella dokdonensis]
MLLTVLVRLGITKSDSQRLSSIPVSQRLKVAGAAFVALLAVTSTSLTLADNTSTVFLLASMGASAVLLFGLPNSPLAKPWSFAAGHLISAAIGLACSHIIDDLALMAAVTIALTLLAMYVFECMHPPGGATALVPVLASSEQHLGYDFLLYPVALNVLCMLLMAVLLNRLLGASLLSREPVRQDPVHLHQDPSPLKRLGLQPDDLLYALNHYQSVLDVSEQDLEQIYHQAQLHAAQRKIGALLCSDIMSRDLICVAAETPLPTAWQLLRKHKIRLLPVVDAHRELQGVLSLTDFVKEVRVPHYWGFLRQLNRLLLGRQYGKARRSKVEDIMVRQVRTVKESDHIVSLIPQLADQGLHHIPVVNADNRLVGMITQSDLIGALYLSSVHPQPISYA